MSESRTARTISDAAVRARTGASASKTIAADADGVYRAWRDEATRQRWLPDPIVVRRATPGKSLRITWPDGSSVDVDLFPRGVARTQVSLSHTKLTDAQAVARMKAHWREALGRVAACLSLIHI